MKLFLGYKGGNRIRRFEWTAAPLMKDAGEVSECCPLDVPSRTERARTV
jgi:hypothetical protein